MTMGNFSHLVVTAIFFSAPLRVISCKGRLINSLFLFVFQLYQCFPPTLCPMLVLHAIGQDSS